MVYTVYATRPVAYDLNGLILENALNQRFQELISGSFSATIACSKQKKIKKEKALNTFPFFTTYYKHINYSSPTTASFFGRYLCFDV